MTRRVFGIETEYGITFNGGAPGVAVDTVARNVVAALVPLGHAHPVPSQQSRTDTWLTNGARCYVDMGDHPEYATPETLTVTDAVAYMRAGDLIIDACRAHAQERLRETTNKPVRIQLFRNNLDMSGSTFGSHENYLVDRAVPFADVVNGILGHVLTRSLFCGAGRYDQGRLWLTQRAPHLQKVQGAETTTKRPLLNSRDEPHSDSKLWRRLHLICGDATMMDMATFLRVGTTHLVLNAVEAGHDLSGVCPQEPLQLLADLDKDPFTAAAVKFVNVHDRTVTALAAQRQLFEAAAETMAGTDPSVEDQLILSLWDQTLNLFEAENWDTLARNVDWVMKAHLFDHVPERKRQAVDVFWHAVDPSTSLHHRYMTKGEVNVVVSSSRVAEAVSAAPAGRARVRTSLIAQALERSWRPIPDWAQVNIDGGVNGWKYLPLPDPFDDTDMDVTDDNLNTGGPGLVTAHDHDRVSVEELLIMSMGNHGGEPWVAW